MIYKFKTRYLRISSRKLRPLLVELKNKKTSEAIDILNNRPEKGAALILKSLNAAIAGSLLRDASEDELKINLISVDEGPHLKRRLYKPRGRADLILKRMSHLTIALKDKRKKKSIAKKTEI